MNTNRFKISFLCVLCVLCGSIAFGQATQPSIADADQAALAAVGNLYNAAISLSSAATAAAADAVVARKQTAAVSAELAAANIKLAAQPQGSAGTFVAGGQATSLTLPDSVTLSGLNFSGEVFNAAQRYALLTGNKDVVNGVVATTDSGGIEVCGDGCAVNAAITNGNGQNGLSGHIATNFTINNAISQGNNTKAFSVYNEAGGGKFSKCSNGAINTYNCSLNLGVGLWFDVYCQNITVNGGKFDANAPADPTKQVSNVRIEESLGIALSNCESTVAKGQNTAFEICDANHVSILNCNVTGQIGMDKTARVASPAWPFAGGVSDVTIKGNQIHGSIWDSGITIPNLVIEGNTYTVPKGQAIGYLKGKIEYTIKDMQAVGLEMTNTGKVVNP